MKGFVKKMAAVAMCAAVVAPTATIATGCGNKDLMDMHYTFHYVVMEENGEHVLHRINKWSDSESESVTISTDCCDNYIWTSSNKAVLYKNKPNESTYDKECTREI